MARLRKLVSALEILFIRAPVMLFLATSVLAYEFFVVPDSEQVELTGSSPEVAKFLILLSFVGVVMNLCERLGLEKAYNRLWSYIHRIAQYARRQAPQFVTLSMLQLLKEIEDQFPMIIGWALSLPLLIPVVLCWTLLLPRLRSYIWDPLFKRVVPSFWLTINSRVYANLEPSKPVIRLLHVLPGAYDDPIICRLIEADVREAEFEAVSYAWGGHRVLRRRIWINGFSFFVTENIIKALRHLRHTGQVRTLWIDQMCINQLDDVEKTNQVTHKMHLVYQNATQVIAWLGVGSSDINWAFQHAIKHEGQSFETIEGAEPPPEKADETASWIMQVMMYPLVWGFEPADTVKEPVIKLEETIQERYTDIWSRVFGRKWFRRIWVIQETALARQLVVRCGEAEMSWDALKHAARDLHTIYQRGPGGEPQTLMNFAGGANERSDKLLDLAVRFSAYQATDPRDKLIGLLALARDGQQFSEVGYGFHEKAVFANFTVACIERSQNLGILALAESRNVNNRMPEGSHCSWALDWSMENTGGNSPKVLWGVRIRKSQIAEVQSYSASGHRPAVCRKEHGPPIPPLARGIFLRGWHEDTVEAVSAAGSGYSSKSMLTVLPIWKELVMQRFPNDTSVEDKFSKLITAELLPGFKEQPWGTWYVPQAFSPAHEQEGVSEDIRHASTILEELCHDRRLFITSKGRIGIGPPGTSVGDEICVLEGSAVPFVLRRWNDWKRLLGGYFSRKPFDFNRPYCYVGQAVVSGLMYNSSDDINSRVSSGEILLKEIWLR